MIDSCWQVTAWYLLVLLPLVLCMKLLSLWRNSPGDRRDLYSFLVAPSLSFSSWRNRRKVCRKDVFVLAGKSLAYCAILWVVIHFKLQIPADMSPWLQGYLAVIPFWLMLEMAQALLQILWLPTGQLVPHINVQPILTVSLAEFWGRRWNRLFGDWLREICFKPLFRTPHLGLPVAFFISALIHELLVSVPYLIVYEKSLFGLMIGYFAIQALAISLQRTMTITSPVARRFYCWVVVIGPAPMVLNPGTLQIFHLVVC